jgi:hypothetical protein
MFNPYIYKSLINPAFSATFMPTPKAVIGTKLKTNEKIGIEVELEKVRTKSSRVPYWTQTNDGSLKIKGREFTICVYSNKARQAIDILKDFLYTKDTSIRTSIHIHLNVDDLTHEQVALFAYYYFIFETPLIKYSGGRFQNFFCVPINQWWRGSPNTIFQWKKYSSINIYPTTHESKNHHLHTIEFRSMRGNINPDYIQNWVDLIVNLKHFIKTQTFTNLTQLLLEGNQTSSYYSLLREAFKTKVDLLYYPEIETDIETSLSLLKFNLWDQNFLLLDLQKVLSTETKVECPVHPKVFGLLKRPTTNKTFVKQKTNPNVALNPENITSNPETSALNLTLEFLQTATTTNTTATAAHIIQDMIATQNTIVPPEHWFEFPEDEFNTIPNDEVNHTQTQ